MSLRLMLRKCMLAQNLANSFRPQSRKWKQPKVRAASLLGYVATVKDMLFAHNKPEDETPQPIQSERAVLIQKADSLFATQQYNECYNLLTQARYDSDPEILWRLSRLLFIMSENIKCTKLEKEEMITKGYYLIQEALRKGENYPEVHKWMAVLLNAISGQYGIHERVKAIPKIKKHLLQALELDPTDVTVMYMLGFLCYQLASLTWFQRQLASFLFATPPTSSFEEAHEFFLRAEMQKPRFFVSNMYMLGKSCYDMGKYYRAKYYFDIAAGLPCRNKTERFYAEKAKKLSAELQMYDLSKHVLFFEKQPFY